MVDVVVTTDELADLVARVDGGSWVAARAAGPVVGADLRGLTVQQLDLDPRWWAALLGRAAPRGRGIPTFVGCDLSGLRGRLVGRARFERCRLEDVDVDAAALDADLVGCVVSGRWAGVLTTASDEYGRLQVTGNDLRRLDEVDLLDVPLGANALDHGGRHVVVTAADLGTPGVRELLPATAVERLELGGAEAWLLLHRVDDPALADALVRRLRAPAS